MTATIDKLTDEIAEVVIAKAGPKLLAFFRAEMTAKDDPLLTVAQVARRIKMSAGTVYQLIETGALVKARGLSTIRIRQSVVDAWGTQPAK